MIRLHPNDNFITHHGIQGGKIKSMRGFTKAIHSINPISQALHNKQIRKGMIDLGQFTNEQLLPAVVSTGIPVASSALGALAGMYGGPVAAQLAQQTSQNLMEKYIPQSHQSKNPYTQMLGDALSMGVTGDYDPMEMYSLQNQFMGQVDKELTRHLQPKNTYNPDNPFQDIIYSTANAYRQYYIPEIKPEDNPNDDNDALYKNGKLGIGADSISFTSPPYQQREGSMVGMLGGDIHFDINSHNMRNGRYTMSGEGSKKKKKSKVKKVEIVKRLPHQKFSHSENSSLEQLLEAQEEKKEKERKKKKDLLVEKQTKALTALGYGIEKPLKGSPEMKEKMAKLRAMRKKK